IQQNYYHYSTTTDNKLDKPHNNIKKNKQTEIFNRYVANLSQHLSGRVTIETICKNNLIGRSQLQKIFSKKSGLGIIEYFSNMKIEAAKELIRTEDRKSTRMNSSHVSCSYAVFCLKKKK